MNFRSIIQLMTVKKRVYAFANKLEYKFYKRNIALTCKIVLRIYKKNRMKKKRNKRCILIKTYTYYQRNTTLNIINFLYGKYSNK